MLKPDWSPERRTLQQFAALWLLLLTVIAVVRAWRGGAFQVPLEFGGPWLVPVGLFALALLIGVPGILAPSYIRPVYVGLLMVTFPIGWVVSHVVLAVMYFGLFTGIGMVLRLIGRDRLNLRFDRSAPTYWRDRQTRSNAGGYFKLS